MEELHKSVVDWLTTGADYDHGVALFYLIGRNRNMAALFPGRKQRYESKLRYELCKSVGIDWREVPIIPVPGVPVFEVAAVDQTEFSIVDTTSSVVDGQSYPPVVRRVIHEYGEGYRKRSQLHLQMTSLPENNQPEIVAHRRDLLIQIKALSLRMELLFHAKENYQLHRIVPDPAVLWPEPAVSPGSSSRDKPLPDDPVELRRLKKNLQTYNVKDNNMLLYQSVTAQSEKHPMQDGPRRMGLEKRIRGRLRTISQIELKLVEDAD